MPIDETQLSEQLTEDIPNPVRATYLLLARAKLPADLDVSTSGHGYIEKELRYKLNGRWYFSAVLNKSWVLWYFRRPALTDLGKEPSELLSLFPASELTGSAEVKIRIEDMMTAHAVLGWISQNV